MTLIKKAMLCVAAAAVAGVATPQANSQDAAVVKKGQ